MNISSDIATVSSLRTWHAALAGRHYSPAVIAAIGGSATEGVGVSAYGRDYLAQLTTGLRARFPVSTEVTGEAFAETRRRLAQPAVGAGAATVGGNFVSAWSEAGDWNSYPWPSVRSGGTANATTGWGLRTVQFTAAAQTLTFAFVGSSVHVWYSIFAGGGTFSITIDGVVMAASVTTDNTVTNRNGRWMSPVLPPGQHQMVVTCLTPGSAGTQVHGFAVFNGDESRGIQVYNGGHSGRETGDYTTQAAGWAPRLATIQPHLVILDLGWQDWRMNVPVATMKANLKSIIATVRANTTTSPSFVILGSPKLSNLTPSQDFALFTTAWREVVTEDTGGIGGSGVAYFDLAARQTAPATNNTLGLYTSDQLSPSDKGAAHIADALTAFLSP
jgi:lysophospholipase L1-like esterase